MAQRRLHIVTVAGLLVVAAGDQVLNERAGGVIAAASAQESEEAFEDAEEYVEEADEEAADAEEDGEDDTSWADEEGGDEQDAAASDESGAEEEAADEEQAEPEAAEGAPSEPQPPAVAQAAPVSNRERVYQTIVDATKEVIPTLNDHAFQNSDSLKSLGANSVDRADIIMMTLERLALNVPLVELAKAENIGALADLLAAKLP